MAESSDVGVLPNAALIADGWVRRYLADPNRAREAVQTYTEAGFEVLLEELEPRSFAASCSGCAATVCATYTVVYTRKRALEDP